MHFIRNAPWYLFYPLVLATITCIIGLFLLASTAGTSMQAVSDEGRMIARRTSLAQYYFKVRGRGLFGHVMIVLETADRERKQVPILFSRKHPDRDRIKQLVRLEVVGFEYTEAPIPCVPRSEICAYLRLKTRSTLWS